MCKREQWSTKAESEAQEEGVLCTSFGIGFSDNDLWELFTVVSRTKLSSFLCDRQNDTEWRSTSSARHGRLLLTR